MCISHNKEHHLSPKLRNDHVVCEQLERHAFCEVASPQPGFVKLNFDRSRNHISIAGGFVICDWTGKLLKAGASYYGEASILVAEARALQEGVCAMIQAGFKNIIIEGDNLTVIQALCGHIHSPWRISMIIAYVREWLKQEDHIIINHCFREANMVANWLADHGHTSHSSFTADQCFSHPLRSILADDIIGCALVRRAV